MHIVEVFGRIFISSLFIVEAIRKFLTPDISMMYMSQYGVLNFFLSIIIFELIFPLLLIVGFKTRIVASFLFLFVLTVTIIFTSSHNDGCMQLITLLKKYCYNGWIVSNHFKQTANL